MFRRALPCGSNPGWSVRSRSCRSRAAGWSQGCGRSGPVTSIGRERYAELFGPTVGDRVRLADTNLLIEVTEDLSMGAGAGDEVIFGGGKVIRESMGQALATRAEGAP